MRQPLLLCLLKEHFCQYDVRQGAHDSRAGNGHDPGRDHLPGDAPVDSFDALCRTDTHNRPGNDVCRRDGQVQQGGREDDDR